MSLRQRNYFFDPTNTDRFNSRDIPTEQTMFDWSESVPFIKEVVDRAQLQRAGLAKTTTDAKVNTGDDTDQPGVSPYGFTTFVRPSQIPRMLNSASITWVLVPRGGATNTDTGVGINDWQANVIFPSPVIPEDTDDITTALEWEVRKLQGLVCDSLTVSSDILPAGSPLTDVIDKLVLAVESIIDRFTAVAARACGTDTVGLGDVIMSAAPSTEWSDKWLEPNGQLVNIVDYPDLFAILGVTYGGDGINNFRLPNLTTGNKYLRAKNNAAVGWLTGSGGANTYTLTNVNIPLHTHTFSGNTNVDGAHTHAIPTDNGLGTNNSARTGDAPSGAFNVASGGTHQHSFSGTTNAYGQNPPVPVAIEPEYNSVYLKMRVRP